MKNVVAIYGNYDTNALLLKARLQTLSETTNALDEVFMSSTAHELTPKLQVLDTRRDKALMGNQKRTDIRTAYDEITFDTVAFSRVAIDKTAYYAIIDELNGLFANYNTSVILRLAGRSTDTGGGDNIVENIAS